MLELIETNDKALLLSLFRRNPIDTMYLAGDLAAPAFERCRWFAAIDGRTAHAVVLL